MKATIKKHSNFLRATLILSCVFINSFGQDVKPADPKPADNGQMKTLFSGSKLNIHYLGLYVAPETQFSSLAGQMTPMGGASAMLLLNKKWAIGVSAATTLDRSFTPTQISTTKALTLNARYAGVKFEYTPKPDAVVHVSFPLSIGLGWLNADSVKYVNVRGKNNDFFEGDRRFGNNNFVVIQPGINVEANLFRYAKIFAGASYRISVDGYRSTTTTTTGNPLANTNFQGLSLNLGLKVGLFDYELKHRKKHNKM